MASIHVGICHNDDFMVTEALQVKCLAVFFRSDGYAECSENIFNLFVIEDFMLHGFFYVQDLSSKWQDSLKVTVPALFGRSSR